MNNINTTITSEVDRFPSLSAMKAEHNTLLQMRRDKGDTSNVLSGARAFIEQGMATGALLDKDDDRWNAQSLLDYWANHLYRTGQEPPEASLVEFDLTLAPELSDAICPYRGLDAFYERDSSYFFGRRRLIASALEHLRRNRLLSVVGPSGSGKSSLVLAGLLPALKAGEVSGSHRWYYCPPMVPGSNPLANLARVLFPDRHDAVWLAEQVAAFSQDEDYLLTCFTNQKTPAVLVIDQFEELFTLCRDDDVRHAFMANLFRWIQSPQVGNRLILTMRIDFEPYIMRLPELQPHFEANLLRVTPLNAAELREAVEAPADLIGLKFEEGVVDALLQDVLGEPAALPLLQFTLLKLWENRERNRVSWNVYRRLGGGRLALAYSADQLYDELIPEDQITFKRIILRMVRPTEGLEVTSNRVRREVLYQTGEARDRVDRVLEKLIQARLLRLTEGDMPGDAQVEVAHEALVRNWPRLVEWLEDEREYLRRRQRLTVAAEQWEAHNRDPGALLRGAILVEALSYEDLNALEKEFLQASQQVVEAVNREKEAQRERELALARELAEHQAKSTKRFRRALILSCIQIVISYASFIVLYLFSTDPRILLPSLVSLVCIAPILAVAAFFSGGWAMFQNRRKKNSTPADPKDGDN